MQTWQKISLLLCTYGFFHELRPSEPFVYEFLSGEWRNVTGDQVNRLVYPVGTYAVLAQLIIVFLITDILRYKPIIIVSASAGIVLFAILLWTKEIWELQIGQLFYGTFVASEVAYYTYIYASVDKSHYQLVTGHTRSAILCGKFLAGVMAQIIISADLMDYRALNYISFGSLIVSLFIALSLPTVPRSLYFFNTIEENASKDSNIKDNTPSEPQTVGSLETNAVKTPKPHFLWRRAISLLWQHAVSAYSKPVVLQWSLWWALATCGQVQVITYAQILWKEIDTPNVTIYNGAVEAVVTLLGAAGAMVAGFMNSSSHKRWHMSILTLCSLLMGIFILISAVTHHVVVAYVMYIIFGITYFYVITVASATVAEHLSDDSFGLIFGINTLVALVLQALLTIIIIDDSIGYGLSVRDQFIVYGCYFIGLSIVFLFVVLIRLISKKIKCDCQ